MKRIALAVLALLALSSPTRAAWTEFCSAPSSESPILCADDDKLLLSQLPGHHDSHHTGADQIPDVTPSVHGLMSFVDKQVLDMLGNSSMFMFPDNANSSSPAEYKLLRTTPSGGTEYDQALLADETPNCLIYLSPPGYPGVTSLPAGTWQLHLWRYSSGVSGTNELKGYVKLMASDESFRYLDSGGYYTSGDIDDLTNTLQVITFDAGETTMDSTERIAITICGFNDGAPAQTLHYTLSGSAHQTMLLRPSGSSGGVYIPLTQKGAGDGVATLDPNSLVPIAQIPIGTGTDTDHVVGTSDPRLTDARASTDTLYSEAPAYLKTSTGTATMTSAAIASVVKIGVSTGTGTNHVITGADPRLTNARASSDTMYAAAPAYLTTGTSTVTATSAAVANSPKVGINTGTGIGQVITGADGRLTDARASTNTFYVTAGLALTTGTSTTTATSAAIAGNPTLSAPGFATTAHATSHYTGGDQIADATTSVHGLFSTADKTGLDAIRAAKIAMDGCSATYHTASGTGTATDTATGTSVGVGSNPTWTCTATATAAAAVLVHGVQTVTLTGTNTLTNPVMTYVLPNGTKTSTGTLSIVAADIGTSSGPSIGVIPISDGAGRLDSWVTRANKGNYYATNTATKTTDTSGNWLTVASVSLAGSVGSMIAWGAVTVSGNVANTCHARIVLDDTQVGNEQNAHTDGSNTYALSPVAYSTFTTGTHTVALQIAATNGSTCSQNGFTGTAGSLVVQEFGT
jgi:hypothetical protein